MSNKTTWFSKDRQVIIPDKTVNMAASYPLTTTLHHWLSLIGRSRRDWTHLAKAGYMMVSLLGRMAMGSTNSEFPDLVTQATCR